MSINSRVRGLLEYVDLPVRRKRLPPGDMVDMELLERKDRQYVLKRSADLGPVFRGTARGDDWVYIVGLSRGRRFLKEHDSALEVCSQDLTNLFPKGVLRMMGGDDHRVYRTALLRAVHSSDSAGMRRVAARHLAVLHEPGSAGVEPADKLRATMQDIATEFLISAFFGVRFGSREFDQLIEGYHELGPHGLVWNPQARQVAAFDKLRTDLHKLLAASDVMAQSCVMARIDSEAALDETMLGNLIYMVEMGRADIQVFLRWLTMYASQHPIVMEEIAAEAESESSSPTATAFVNEQLRTDQSERLERRATRDFTFDRFFIRRGTYVRICMWESHHDAEVFFDPARFDPRRFLTEPPLGDQFSPFGLDHHKCPFASLTTRLGSEFLEALTAGYIVQATEIGKPFRGAYHWEPSRRLAVELTTR